MSAPTLLLAGQAAAPPGPCDLSGMYLMHHGFRRDLTRFVAAARRTPTTDLPTWRLLRARWHRFADLLHEHHSKEDEAMWPLLLERVDAAGDRAARGVLEAMEAEHERIDPLLTSVADELEGLVRSAAEGDAVEHRRDRLVALLVETRRVLDDHLAHEERDAIAVLQAHVSETEWAELERTRLASRPTRPGDLFFLLGWIADDVDPDDLAPFLTAAGPVVRVLLRLGRGRHERHEARAFAHCPDDRSVPTGSSTRETGT